MSLVTTPNILYQIYGSLSLFPQNLSLSKEPLLISNLEKNINSPQTFIGSYYLVLQILPSDGIPFWLIFTWILLFSAAEAYIPISTAFCTSLVKTSRSWRTSSVWRQINKNKKQEQISVSKSPQSHPEVTESSRLQRPESAFTDKCIYCIYILVTWIEWANSPSNSLIAPKPWGLFHPRECSCAFQMLATWGSNHDVCCIRVWVGAEGSRGCPSENFKPEWLCVWQCAVDCSFCISWKGLKPRVFRGKTIRQSGLWPSAV